MFPEHAVKAYAEVDGQVFQVSQPRPCRAVRLKEVGTGMHLCLPVSVHFRPESLQWPPVLTSRELLRERAV